jgi:cell division protein FtsL
MRQTLLRYALVLVCVALSGWALLYTSQRVQKSRGELAKVERDIAAEKTRIDVLEGEWSYLNSPERLEVLSAKLLDLQPPSAKDPAMVNRVSELPLDKPAEAPLVPEAASFEVQGGPDAE